MNKGHKIFILLFVGVLGFLVFRGWVFLKTQYLPAVANIDTNKRQAVVDSDFDNDGLSDIEESFYGTDFQNPDTDGDGYLDGEELASGYDPRIPAPRDVRHGRISREAFNINITERLTGRLYASIEQGEIDTNDLESTSNILDLIAYNTTLESAPIFYAEHIDESSIVVLHRSTNEDVQNYIDRLFTTLDTRVLAPSVGQSSKLETMLENFDENGSAYRDAGNYYLTQTRYAINELLLLKVPEPWIDDHIKMINKMKDFEALYKAFESTDNDIMKAVVVSQKLFELYVEFDDVFVGLIMLADDYGLDLPNLSLTQLYKNEILSR